MRRLAILGAALFVAAAVPFWFSPYWVTVGIDVCVFAILGASYNLLLGRIGLFSLGHALLFGLAAYVVANVTTRSGVPLLPAAALAVLASALVAAVTGLVASGARGIYFAMMTLAFAQVGFVLAETDAAGLSGGEDGLTVSGIPELLNVNVRQDGLYWLALATLIAVLAVVAVLRNSAAGRLWSAIRENEVRAAAVGYNVPRFKLAAFVIGGAFSGLAGVLYAMLFGIVPLEAIGFVASGNVVFATLIGGSGSLYGPVIGSFVFIWLSESMSVVWERWPLLLGVAFVIVVLFFRGGVVEAWSRFWRWQSSRQKA
jgi:branched-chain amino acid transport system permease protein